MTSRILASLLAIAVAAAALPAPARAIEIAEVHGDFYYDRDGNLIGHRRGELPPGPRQPMSHKEQFARMGLQLPSAGFRTSLAPRVVPAKPDRVRPEDGRTDLVVVKFRDAEPVRLRNGRLDAAGRSLPTVETILAGFPDATLARAFDAEERILDENRETGQLLSGKELADLNNYYVIRLPEGSPDGVEIANALNGLDEVELAYLQAEGQPPACGDIAPTTTDLESTQFYRDPAPSGVDIGYAEAYHSGGNGTPGFWVMDLEWDWCQSHEDLNFSSSSIKNTYTSNVQATMWHGTAVLGEIGSCDNGYGVSGLTPDVTLSALDFDGGSSYGGTIGTADTWLYAGEVMLLEIHIPGPTSGLTCTCDCPGPGNPNSQFEFVPVEWDQASFDAISTAVANGVIVVEPAGNGTMNLDNSVYGNKFQTWYRDSGAIMVGASDTGHAPMCWTNYGSRVDVHAYGTSVTTTGYGDAFDGVAGTCGQEYTYAFSGTSSASPIIVGVCASVQGIAEEKYGVTLDPAQMRSLIKVGATPQTGTNNIGPMPDLVNAINEVEPDLLPYTPSGWSYPLVPRLVAGTTFDNCPLPSGALPGGGTTYFNWADQNNPLAYSPTVNSAQNGVYVEDALWFFGSGVNLAPGSWTYAPDLAFTIKGGRHTIRMESDVFDVEQEWIETNNSWNRQFIWSGLALGEDAPVSRSADPIAVDSQYVGPYYNAEGFQATPTSGYWHAFAVTPTNAADDYDIRLNAVAPTNIPQAGFGASVASSFTPAGETAVVAWDLNTVASGTYWASVLNFAGTANKIVEFDSDDGTLATGVNGPYTMFGNDIVDVYELYLNGGTEYRVQVEALSGSADIGISLLDGTSGYHDKVSTVLAGGYADNAGPGQDEHVFVTPAVGDYYGLLVWKKGSADVSQSLTYNVHISTDPNLVGDRTASLWDYPIVPRNDRNAVLLVDLPPTLNGWQPTTSFNWATFNEGANQAASPWETDLFVDDALRLTSTASTSLSSGAFWVVMNSVQSEVRGGRHYLRSSADVLGQLPEFDETDNDFVDWFVWSPLDVSAATGSQPVPSESAPFGFNSWYACDGYTATGDPSTYWTGVAILPLDPADDYDIRLHDAYVGSKNGFGSPLASSLDGPGATDFVIVNHNVLPQGAYDYGVLNLFDGTKGYQIRQADAPFYANVPAGVSRYGPFSAGTPDPLELYEFYIDSPLVGVPVYISLNALSGSPNLGLAVYDGAIGAQQKTGALAIVDAEPGGQDEHLGPVYFPAANYYCVAVYKQGAADRTLTGTYELVFSTGGSAVDAPETGSAPTDFALAPPSPNPFRSAATVRFDVPRPADVRVGVYDLTGRRVRTLAEGSQPAGHHTVSWDGRDGGGRRVGAGIYFVRLETAGRSEIRKVTLLR